MFRKIREAQKNEEGFTLIELLVVVIIIGILAAIAIPAFLSQRERAYQAGLTSDVRNLALELEAISTANNGAYPADPTTSGLTVATDVTVSTDQSNVTTTLTYFPNATNTGFCLHGTRSDLTGTVAYASVEGGMQSFEVNGETAATACTAYDTANPVDLTP